jgi:hypothetical protein
MAYYFDKISDVIHKDLGEKLHQKKIDLVSNEYMIGDDSPLLKRSADKLQGKMEVINGNLKQGIKFRKDIEKTVD